MDWITEKQAKEAAEKGTIPALECSLKHHEQGRDADYVELRDAMESRNFTLDYNHCSCCQLVGKTNGSASSECTKCVLGSDFCWVNTKWDLIRDAIIDLRNDYSNANFKAFREAEAELCKYIEKVLEVEKAKAAVEPPFSKCKCDKPKFRHGDYGFLKDKAIFWVFLNGKMSFSDGDSYISGCSTELWTQRRLGNIFDDLQRNSEDLKEFEMKFDGGGWIKIRIDKVKPYLRIESWIDFATATLDEATEYHQKLGQVIAFAKRKQK